MLSSQHYQLQQAVIQIASTPLSASLKDLWKGLHWNWQKIKTLATLILQFSPNVLLEHLPTPLAHSHYFLCFHFNQLEQAKCGNTLFQRQDTISQLMGSIPSLTEPSIQWMPISVRERASAFHRGKISTVSTLPLWEGIHHLYWQTAVNNTEKDLALKGHKILSLSICWKQVHQEVP